jgi:hypothetical protein
MYKIAGKAGAKRSAAHMVTVYKDDGAEWYDWLNEPVTWDSTREVTRGRAIQYFVEEGLYPFIERSGYAWGSSPADVKNGIATGLFINDGKSCLDSRWRFGRYMNTGKDEDLWHFESVIDADGWGAFWRKWGLWSDVDPTTERGLDRQTDIQHYCWLQIDLDRSRQRGIMDEIIYGPDWDDDHGGRRRDKEDTYLREAAESNQWDGYRR